ncbi:MAG: hypothetical protein K2X49_24330 [Acetobacteraceae bacterium]|nr:hypothetical protein [Acetobacteraceae bacterium]
MGTALAANFGTGTLVGDALGAESCQCALMLPHQRPSDAAHPRALASCQWARAAFAASARHPARRMGRQLGALVSSQGGIAAGLGAFLAFVIRQCGEGDARGIVCRGVEAWPSGAALAAPATAAAGGAMTDTADRAALLDADTDRPAWMPALAAEDARPAIAGGRMAALAAPQHHRAGGGAPATGAPRHGRE